MPMSLTVRWIVYRDRMWHKRQFTALPRRQMSTPQHWCPAIRLNSSSFQQPSCGHLGSLCCRQRAAHRASRSISKSWSRIIHQPGPSRWLHRDAHISPHIKSRFTTHAAPSVHCRCCQWWSSPTVFTTECPAPTQPQRLLKLFFLIVKGFGFLLPWGPYWQAWVLMCTYIQTNHK